MFHSRLLALVCLLFASPAAADPVSDFYAGRTLSLTIGYAPGGGYDSIARLLARHMGKHIPGRPTFIVRNMPGGGGLIAANALYNIGTRDGSELAIFADTIPFAPLWNTAGAQFDPTKFHFLGSLDRREAGVALAWRASGVQTIEDARTRTVTVGSTGTHDITSVAPRLLNTLAGTRFKIVGGYRGIPEGSLAMERGEIDGWQGWCWPCLKDTKPEWISRNSILPLVQFGRERHADLPNVPTIYELATNDDDRRIMRLVFTSDVMSRFVVVGPGAPADRVEALRKAFDSTMSDPDFRADALKSNIPLHPANAQAVEALIRDAYATPPTLLARARAIVNGE
jgi:tripartite-type tricarboxylate transporter receptor subunit TctC